MDEMIDDAYEKFRRRRRRERADCCPALSNVTVSMFVAQGEHTSHQRSDQRWSQKLPELLPAMRVVSRRQRLGTLSELTPVLTVTGVRFS